MFSRSFGGEIPAAILFPSVAVSASPCVHGPSIVGVAERTLLRSSPILRPQASLTPNMHCMTKICRSDSFTPTCSYEIEPKKIIASSGRGLHWKYSQLLTKDYTESMKNKLLNKFIVTSHTCKYCSIFIWFKEKTSFQNWNLLGIIKQMSLSPTNPHIHFLIIHHVVCCLNTCRNEPFLP